MKIRIASVAAFRDSFDLAARVAPKKSPNVAMQNVLCSTDGMTLALAASSFEADIALDVEGVEVIEAGTVLLSADRFGQVLKQVNPADPVEVTTRGDAVEVKARGSKFTLVSSDPGKFPSEPIPRLPADLTLAAGDLRRLIKRTVFAVDEENRQYAMGGSLIESKADSASLVATDGRRLARSSVPNAGRAGDGPRDPGPVVPARTLRLLSGCLDGDEDRPVDVAFRDNRAVFYAGPLRFSARLAEGRFPRYAGVMPELPPGLAVLAGPLRAAVAAASVATSEESRGLEFALAPGLLTIGAATADVGQSQVELPVEYEGPARLSRFDFRYISQGLADLEAEMRVEFRFKDCKEPAMLTGEGWQYMIMPLSK